MSWYMQRVGERNASDVSEKSSSKGVVNEGNENLVP